jgi:hypothetical protein
MAMFLSMGLSLLGGLLGGLGGGSDEGPAPPPVSRPNSAAYRGEQRQIKQDRADAASAVAQQQMLPYIAMGVVLLIVVLLVV